MVKDVESQVHNAAQCDEFLSGEPSDQIMNLISFKSSLKMPLLRLNMMGESCDLVSCLV